jgi:FkbM family methyltransferase
MRTYAAEYLRLFGMRGLICAAAAKLYRHPVTCRLRRPGLRHEFSVRVPSSDVLVFRQVFHGGEYEFDALRPPRVIVDAGANVGLSALYFANRYPTAHILAVEPEARNFALLASNVAPYTNVTPVEGAVWGENADVDLFDPGIGHWGYVTRSAGESGPGAWRQRVRGFTIDRLMDDYGLAHVDVLKLDIEGSELEVLGRPHAWIDRVDAVLIELHDRLASGCRDAYLSATASFQDHWHQGETECAARRESAIRRHVPATTMH